MSDISWIGKNRMELLHKIALLAMVGLVVGLVTAVPVMADDDDDDDKKMDEKVHNKKKWGVLMQEWLKKVFGETDPNPQTQNEEQVTLIKRVDFVELCGDVPCGSPYGKRLNQKYSCEEEEIVVGGIVESSQPTSPGSWSIDHESQEFIVNLSNRDSESVLVTVIYLCASMKS